MDEVYIDAVQQLINSSQVRNAINQFMDAHCHEFELSEDDAKGEYALGTHKIYLDFQALVEGIIERALQELGGDAEALVKALDEGARAACSVQAISLIFP